MVNIVDEMFEGENRNPIKRIRHSNLTSDMRKIERKQINTEDISMDN